MDRRSVVTDHRMDSVTQYYIQLQRHNTVDTTHNPLLPAVTKTPENFPNYMYRKFCIELLSIWVHSIERVQDIVHDGSKPTERGVQLCPIVSGETKNLTHRHCSSCRCLFNLANAPRFSSGSASLSLSLFPSSFSSRALLASSPYTSSGTAF